MSTYNIGFYEDLTKNIFELSSNIIKYAPYFFCCGIAALHYANMPLQYAAIFKTVKMIIFI